jgi:hypothetical protein
MRLVRAATAADGAAQRFCLRDEAPDLRVAVGADRAAPPAEACQRRRFGERRPGDAQALQDRVTAVHRASSLSRGRPTTRGTAARRSWQLSRLAVHRRGAQWQLAPVRQRVLRDLRGAGGGVEARGERAKMDHARIPAVHGGGVCPARTRSRANRAAYGQVDVDRETSRHLPHRTAGVWQRRRFLEIGQQGVRTAPIGPG